MLRLDKNRKRKRVHSFFEANKKARLIEAATLDEVVVDPIILPAEPPAVVFYDQLPLIRKINDYLMNNNLTPLPDDGHCYGVVVVWLQKMADGKIDWFYRVRDAIIHLPLSKMDLIDIDVQKFAAMIEWGQNIMAYLSDARWQNPKFLFESSDIESGKFVGTTKELSRFFHNTRNVIMYLISANKHSIAIYQSDGVYHLFDSNFEDGEAKIISDHHALPNEIIHCLYHTFNESVPDPLNIKLTRIRDPKALKYVAPLPTECDDYRDCESKDHVMPYVSCNIF